MASVETPPLPPHPRMQGCCRSLQGAAQELLGQLGPLLLMILSADLRSQQGLHSKRWPSPAAMFDIALPKAVLLDEIRTVSNKILMVCRQLYEVAGHKHLHGEVAGRREHVQAP